MDLRTSDFDYALPSELIAQEPAARRDESRLLVLRRSDGSLQHDTFSSLPHYLIPGDVLVVNRSRVIPARLKAHRRTGGAVEIFLLHEVGGNRWQVLARPARKLRPREVLSIEGSNLEAVPLIRGADGEWTVAFQGEGDIRSRLLAAGTVPLPPYITNQNVPLDRYQTVYADRDGSVAAPTAGLHFTEKLLDRVRAAGVDVQFVTLHVGAGTFKPVTADRVAEHRMHAEWGEVPPGVAEAVGRARREGRRVVAVGTTTTRILETAAAGGTVRPFQGETNCFITPPYTFKAVDALVTNFHLPRSTLLMLVSALAGRERILAAYAEAVRERYRFFSFGDAMLII